MSPQDWVLEITDNFINVLEGSKNPIQLINTAKEGIGDIRNFLFVHNLEAVINGIQKNETITRKIGKKLAKSDYGEEYGYALLHYIDAYEHRDKGSYMAQLLDSASKDFISPNELFIYCKILEDVSLRSLCFLKDNIQKKIIYNYEREDKACINELLLHDLMYEAEKGYAFSLTGFFLDKYGLSYKEERYKNYGEKMGDIPELKKFPKVPVSILSEGTDYTG